MAVEHKQHVQVVKQGESVRRQRVQEFTPSTRSVIVSRVSRFLWLATTILLGLITLRFVFHLIGANPANGFVNAIFRLTDVFVAPFNNIVNSPALGETAILDIGAVFALVIYLLIAWAGISLFKIIFAGTKSTRHVSTVEHHVEE